MKKHLLIALILTVIPNLSFAQTDSLKAIEEVQENFYEAPAIPIPEVTVVEGSTQPPLKSMPLFKKTRIKLTNYFRERDYKKTQELLKKEKILLDDEEDTNVVEEDTVTPSEDAFELEGGVREQVSQNDVILDADNVDYDDKTFDIIATGSPVLTFPPQNVTIKADKFIYNKASNILKAYGKVEVIRDGNSIFGDFMQINMNEENAFLDNLQTKAAFMTINAKKSNMDEKDIVLYDGKMVSKEDYTLNLQTKMIGGNNFNNMMVDEDDRSSLMQGVGDTNINVKAKEIILNAKKDHDVLTMKDAKINYGDFTLFKLKSVSAHTNKNHEYFEGNYPEFGSRGKLGMFIGPGFVFDTPLQNGSTLKVIPMLNNKNGLGVGGFFKYRSATNYTDIGYGTANSAFVLKGRQQLDDKLYLQYGSNSYMDEWFFGPRMSKYNVELIYRDQAVAPSTIGKNLDLRFKHRFGIGYMHDSDYNRFDEHLQSSNMGTLRTRYMAEIDQTLISYTDEENLKSASLSLVLQGSAALYGTGDTQFIGRIGPRIHTQYKYWMQDIGYFASAMQDNTPLTVYDTYRYGHGSVYLREAWRVCKYLTLAWSGTINLTDDAPNGKMFQENSFIVGLGPDDFKINIGYDWVRRQTYFSFVLAMNTKGSSVDFEKMVIKNHDRLAAKNDDKVELKVFDDGQVQNTQSKKMMYAEVIDIEDPDKEHI